MEGKVYARAKCRTSVSLQAVAVTCKGRVQPAEEVTSVQRCVGDEVCAETGLGEELFEAYCVSVRKFVPISPKHTGRWWMIEGGVQTAVNERDYTVNVLLADKSGTRRLQADMLEAAAWASERDGEARGADSLENDRPLKVAHCRQCSRLIMQPMPFNTNLLTAAASKRTPRPEAGYLYLITIS